MSFETLSLPQPFLRAIADLGFETPTPIQLEAIPPALAGRDLVACAMTGSGKTAAFLLPTLARLLAADEAAGSPRKQSRRGPRVLILSPTRELAAQTQETLVALARHTHLKGAAVFGGVGMGPQEQAFRQGVDVLVATPGRLLDHLQHAYASLAGVEILILDEADRMLDMGFLPDIRRVLSHIPAKRQNLLFSATMPAPIVTLTREMLHQPVHIAVDREAKPATGVTQAIYPVREDLKPFLLLELLRRATIKNVLVFTRTKHRANRLAEMLARHGVACERIHGNRSQAQRTEALARFKNGAIRVLVATDIAARGIDVEALSHVVNFDVPNIPEDYIHRVGRTARAEATGDAWTFVSDAERSDLAAIERAVGNRLQRLTLEGFDYEHKPADRFEVPIAERIAAIRTRKAEERARAKAKAERRGGTDAGRPAAPRSSGGRPGSGGSSRPHSGHGPSGPGTTSHRPAAQPAHGLRADQAHAPAGRPPQAERHVGPRPEGNGVDPWPGRGQRAATRPGGPGGPRGGRPSSGRPSGPSNGPRRGPGRPR